MEAPSPAGAIGSDVSPSPKPPTARQPNQPASPGLLMMSIMAAESAQQHTNAPAARMPPSRGRPGSLAASPVVKGAGTPRKNKQCNCKNSRCLKLYCECFASGVYCNSNCNCANCCNNDINDDVRKEAIESILDRNPDAFRPKIAGDGREGEGGKHNKGCACKRSFCLKRYCECYQAGILCSDNCKCVDCKNFANPFQDGHDKALAGGRSFAENNPGMQQLAMTGGGYSLPPAKRQRIFEPRLGYAEQVLASQGSLNLSALKPMDHQSAPSAAQLINPGLLQDVCNKLISSVFQPEKESTPVAEVKEEPLPTLSAVSAEANTAVDALLCDEAIGPSPSPPVQANGVMAVPPYRPSAWFLAHEKHVFSEFSGVMKNIAQSMQAKAAQKVPLQPTVTKLEAKV